ncbi:helix-turn-helix transcriptional regulator [Microbacterium oleivorans]|uniref:Helix-turn-helix domain-containing protein n=1 Tax=Microbacterium oleivorans TaxID=273677 RepID=A0A7D5F7G0_9MICO|nr:helix-turn-helix transcriptional regulator [Microbacterium oleivorans]QLD12093.1 helix-turn-helix domain-containing protein [Microbacterium oleivorans]
MDRAALASFLRARRERLRPEDVGLPAGARRRVEGLRREEVAQLALMSVDYYTRLEQERGPQPSPQMLASLTRALRLSRSERDHLHRLAGHVPPERSGSADHVAPALQRVLDRLGDVPALIISELDETLAQNDLARAIFGARELRTGPERSGAWSWFAHPAAERAVYPASEHARQSRAVVANLRAVAGRGGPASRAARLAADLRTRSAEFAGLWDLEEVAERFADHKVLLHPAVGEIEVDCQALFTEDRSQALLTLTPEPGSDAAEKLRMLAVLGPLATERSPR